MSCGSVKFCNKHFGVCSAIGIGMMALVGSTPAIAATDSLSQLIAQKSESSEDIKVPPARISTQSSIKRASTQPAISYGASSNSSTNLPSYSTYQNNQSYQDQNYSAQSYQNQSQFEQNSSSYSSNNSSANVSQPKRLTIIQSQSVAQAAPSYSKPQPQTSKTPNYPVVTSQPKAPAVLPAFLRGSGIAGNYDNVDSSYLPLLSQAESQSSRAARNVLATARAMALNERTIIQGGCWDYLNAVFNRAGVSKNTILKGAYKGGPYANPQEIQVGDWLYYINHSYNDIEHSGIFVGWVDEAAKQALILSYAGESRREPARYKVYDLSHVYHIMRPV